MEKKIKINSNLKENSDNINNNDYNNNDNNNANNLIDINTNIIKINQLDKRENQKEKENQNQNQKHIYNYANKIFTSYKWHERKDGKTFFIKINNTYTENNFNKDKNDNDNSRENSKENLKEKLKEKEAQCSSRESRTFDNREKFKLGKSVITEWGLGKIIKIDGSLIFVDIYGNPSEFYESTLKNFYKINILVLINNSSLILEINVDCSLTLSSFKKKIAEIINTHPSLIVLVHSGRTIKKDTYMLELGIYDNDNFMVIVKDPIETCVTRAENSLLNCCKYNSNFNAIKFICNEDIILTAIGLYRNGASDIFYDLMIYEEKEGKVGREGKEGKEGYPNLILHEKKIMVLKKTQENKEIFKYPINNLFLKSNKIYQVHQNILNFDNSSQYSGSGFKSLIEVLDGYVKFQFFECKINNKINGSNLEKGLIPRLFFIIKIENDYIS
jgi:hypothetical protein